MKGSHCVTIWFIEGHIYTGCVTSNVPGNAGVQNYFSPCEWDQSWENGKDGQFDWNS